jgi:hypothetical protein
MATFTRRDACEHSKRRGTDNPQPLTDTFDITDVVQQLGAHGDMDDLTLSRHANRGHG